MRILPRRSWAALVLGACALLSPEPGFAGDAASQPGTGQAISIEDYRAHLEKLRTIVDACAKARDAKTCDPALVGNDDRIPVGTEQRPVRYDWLRTLLQEAQEKDQAPKKDGAAAASGPVAKGVRPRAPTTSELLTAAGQRLQFDIEQAGGTPRPGAGHPQAREAMNKVLSGRDFRNLEEPTIRDTAMEKLGNAINRFFDKIAKFGARSPWIGLLIKWGFFAAICVGLVVGLIQLERRWRLRLVPEQDGPAPDAPSARDWQLWLEDAHRAAAAGRWREAVHFLYWAAISRLESMRLWPADRARTPREYLALVGEDDPRKMGLAALTRSFERIWYGGRDAGEGDYRAAEQTATALISGVGGRE
jgi:hypothetical protein